MFVGGGVMLLYKRVVHPVHLGVAAGLASATGSLSRPEVYNYHVTVCPRRSDPFYVVTYYVKSVTTSWTFTSIYLSMDI